MLLIHPNISWYIFLTVDLFFDSISLSDISTNDILCMLYRGSVKNRRGANRFNLSHYASFVEAAAWLCHYERSG